MAEAKCPGTCGELLQGWIAGSEKLISCPIDMYSHVSVEDGVQRQTLMPLIEQAVSVTLAHLGIESDYRQTLNIEHFSELPIGKGYASSTADICATIVALCRHLNVSITQETIAKFAATLEPSDSVMCQGLALIDHNSGKINKSYQGIDSVSLLILEPSQILLTRDFHALARTKQLWASEHRLDTALSLFEQGISDENWHLVGKAATISAEEHQKMITTPYFSQILNVTEKHDLYGLCIAHSGSILGLLYDETKHNIDSIFSDLAHQNVFDIYTTQRRVNMISGGII